MCWNDVILVMRQVKGKYNVGCGPNLLGLGFGIIETFRKDHF